MDEEQAAARGSLTNYIDVCKYNMCVPWPCLVFDHHGPRGGGSDAGAVGGSGGGLNESYLPMWQSE